MTSRLLMVIILTFAFFMVIPPEPEVEAFDPVTLQILTPFALKAASVLAPYVVTGASRMGKVVLKGLKEGFYMVVYLPVGIVGTTILAPFMFRSSLRFLVKGLVAPVKMIGYFLLIPVQPLGIGV